MIEERSAVPTYFSISAPVLSSAQPNLFLAADNRQELRSPTARGTAHHRGLPYLRTPRLSGSHHPQFTPIIKGRLRALKYSAFETDCGYTAFSPVTMDGMSELDPDAQAEFLTTFPSADVTDLS